MPNRLALESSPYLLQHAHNPVDWYPWGAEALDRAKQEDKPILLSIGYSTCHWCHVMAHESFENHEIAALMNAHYICIKIDREERPDIDAVYMSAVQAMTGSGGWPLTVFITPEGLPFYGGTYFPPQNQYGRPGFPHILESLQQAWQNRRQDVYANAESLSEAVQRYHQRPAWSSEPSSEAVQDRHIAQAMQQLEERFDAQYGGFGEAPKFPAPTTLEFILMHHQLKGEGADMAFKTLDEMAAGGIYDHLGGGFARYSTDAHWLVPHFEKMLYDNAQLARVYLHAYQLSGKAHYAQIVRETLDYLLRDMQHPSGGFYSAQDADQEGIEGLCYVWTPSEFEEILAEDAPLLMRYFGVHAAGNFQDPHHPEFGSRSVLAIQYSPEELSHFFNLPLADIEHRLNTGKARLFAARLQRSQPGIDHKILTSWNGLALAAFAEAGRVLHEPRYLAAAEHNALFVQSCLSHATGLYHSYSDQNVQNHPQDIQGQATGQAKVGDLLEDLVLYGLGLIQLYQSSANNQWLLWAQQLWQQAVKFHWDESSAGFFATAHHAEPLMARLQHSFDAAVISDNGAAALLAAQLAAYTDNAETKRIAQAIVESHISEMQQAATGFGGLWQAALWQRYGGASAVISGTTTERAALMQVCNERYLPVLTLAPQDSQDSQTSPLPWPLFAERNGAGVAYVCQRFSCLQPSHSPQELSAQLDQLYPA